MDRQRWLAKKGLGLFIQMVRWFWGLLYCLAHVYLYFGVDLVGVLLVFAFVFIILLVTSGNVIWMEYDSN